MLSLHTARNVCESMLKLCVCVCVSALLLWDVNFISHRGSGWVVDLVEPFTKGYSCSHGYQQMISHSNEPYPRQSCFIFRASLRFIVSLAFSAVFFSFVCLYFYFISLFFHLLLSLKSFCLIEKH